MRESNLYSPSCRALVCVTFCMNVTAGREFLGLHPFFAPKNGWNIKQKFRLFFFLYVHFFLFFYEQKRKKRTKERENNVYQNSLNCIYLQNFLTASLNENFVRKYQESVTGSCGRAAHTAYAVMVLFIFIFECGTITAHFVSRRGFGA